ncbi:MAG: roadblock/LC7 domain-containing protein [Acidobacteria bacterium]|nr:roadblock/LC7 domain-containing protein [Acidobacteriota bacterium]
MPPDAAVFPDPIQLAHFSEIPGVGRHVLVGPQGQVLSHDAEDTEGLAALVAVCAACGRAIGAELGSPDLNHALFQRRAGERFLVVPLGGSALGFFQKKDAIGSELLARVAAWKETLSPD